MRSTKQTPLSTDGSFENIVNAGTEEYRQQKRVWVNKTFRAIVILFGIWLVSLLLCAMGVMSNLAAVMVSEVITCATSFLGGRLWEQAFK